MKLSKRINHYYNNLIDCHFDNINLAFRDFMQLLCNSEELSYHLTKITSNHKEEQFKNEQDIEDAINEIRRNSRFSKQFSSENNQLSFQISVLKNIYQTGKDFQKFVKNCGLLLGGNNPSIHRDKILMYYVKPIYDYLVSKIEYESEIILLLRKYKKKREWFYRDIFFKQYIQEGRRERFLDMDLKSYLFDNGIENLFSAPDSPSGRADIVGRLETDDFIIEVKFLDDSKNYKKEKVISGITQAYNYAVEDSRSSHVVIFNCNENDKKVFIEGMNEEDNSITIGGIKINIFIININPKGKSASKQKKLSTIEINLNEIQNEINKK